jgi:signal transduction histidine kinase
MIRDANGVLCLEDDPLDAELLESTLRPLVPGLRWRHARTRREFERELLAECPDLVLADYKLPDIDGLAALDRTREACGETPFVVVSGAITESFAIESLQRGATDYVLKQRLQRLGPVTQRALAEVRTRRELRESQRLALEIGDREQQRLGADLHDAVGQDLAAVALLLEAAGEQARREAPPLQPRIEEARRLLGRASQGVRGLSRTLAPVSLWPGALGPTLRDLARDAGALYGLACDVDARGHGPSLSEPLANHLYRIAQEALTNAAKHGRARRATIRLPQQPDRLLLEVVDDGTGIDPAAARTSDGLGLRLMEYRARVLGARLQVERGPDRGTVVRVIRDGAAPASG